MWRPLGSCPVCPVLSPALLPPVSFGSIDVSALLHSIRQNEAAINILKDCVTTQQASAKTIVGVVNNVVSRISAVELRQPSVRNAATRPVVPAAIAVPASTSAVPVSALPERASPLARQRRRMHSATRPRWTLSGRIGQTWGSSRAGRQSPAEATRTAAAAAAPAARADYDQH